jgi:hypothetical protein
MQEFGVVGESVIRAVMPQALVPHAVLVAVLPQLLGIIRRRVAQMAGQNQQNTGAAIDDLNLNRAAPARLTRSG